MRVLLAPTAFKGALGGVAASDALERGVRRAGAGVETIRAPVSDGGDSFLEVLLDAHEGERIERRVSGPLGDPVNASFGWVEQERLAIIEMASATGLALLDESRRDPMRTTTRGVGELIRAALDRGAERILVGLGGSATVDGGLGAASALGMRALDEGGDEVEPTGAGLEGVARLDVSGRDGRLDDVELIAAADVTNPLLGEQGAARVYGPQKGADDEDVERLERGLARLAERFGADLGRDVAEAPGCARCSARVSRPASTSYSRRSASTSRSPAPIWS